ASDDEEQLRSVHEHVVDLAETSVTLAVWPRLMKLALSPGEPASAKQAVRAVLDAAPAYDALVVTLESGRILLATEGSPQAWAFLTQVDTLDKLRRALPVSDLQRDGPLLSHGCSLFLRLAARSGDWEGFEAFKRYASTIWPEASPGWLKLGIAEVELELLRSR